MLKVNVDAALFPNQGNLSVACVAHNDQGHATDAITCCKEEVMSPEMAGAMKVREVLS